MRRTRRVRRSEEHTSELQSLRHLVCRLLLEKKKKTLIEAGAARKEEMEEAQTALSTNEVQLEVSEAQIRQQRVALVYFLFFNDTATTEIYTLSLHDALPIGRSAQRPHVPERSPRWIRRIRPLV